MSHRFLLPGLLAATLLGAGSAHAADLDAAYADIPQPVAEQNVEFGSGWYVRGDLAGTRLPNLGLTPSAAGEAPDMYVQKGSGLGYTASLGGGYEFNKWFRADAVFDFHKPVRISQFSQNYPTSHSGLVGTCQAGFVTVESTGAVSPYFTPCHSQNEASLTSYDVLINGYFDIAHWGFATPYVGAGVGMAFGHYVAAQSFYNNDGSSYDTTFTLPGSGGVRLHGYLDKRVASTYYNFAFALMAGVSFDVFDHTKLDVGYRYVNLGRVLNATIDEHEVRAGLRYMIDN